MPRIPTAGTSVTCEVVIHNDGGTGTAATLYLNPFVDGNDARCPGGRWEGVVAANSWIRPQIRFQWPKVGVALAFAFILGHAEWTARLSLPDARTRHEEQCRLHVVSIRATRRCVRSMHGNDRDDPEGCHSRPCRQLGSTPPGLKQWFYVRTRSFGGLLIDFREGHRAARDVGAALVRPRPTRRLPGSLADHDRR